MLFLPVFVHICEMDEGFGAPRLLALELGRPMNCSLVVSQVLNIGHLLFTFLTFRSFANAVLDPHVLRKGSMASK